MNEKRLSTEANKDMLELSDKGFKAAVIQRGSLKEILISQNVTKIHYTTICGMQLKQYREAFIALDAYIRKEGRKYYKLYIHKSDNLNR